jgi:AcrR family transcriptional regulator
MNRNDDEVKREQKRESIMQAALKVFSKKGYSPAALDEVAREASIAKGTLYLYFRDKEDLFSSTIIYVIDKLAAQMLESLSDTINPMEILRNIAYTELDYFAGNMEFFGLIRTAMSGNLLGSHENLLKTLNERRMELIQYLKGVIREASERGQVRKDIETEEMVYGYLGMLESAIEQMHLRWESNPEDEHPIDIKTKVETIMLILLDGIRGEGNE